MGVVLASGILSLVVVAWIVTVLCLGVFLMVSRQ